MTRDSNRWWPVLLLGALAVLTFWLERAVIVSPGRVAQATSAPRFWAEDFTVRRYDPSGVLQNILTATRLTQSGDTNEVVIASPRLNFGANGAVTVTSVDATVSPDGKRVDFRGDVRVTRAADGPGEADVVMVTAAMTAYPDQDRATSNLPVKITKGNMLATGTGLNVNARTGISQLDGPVHATIPPKGSP